MRRGILSVVAAAVTVIGLAGCVGPQPLPTLPPSPSSTPIFASEEEALAAAEDAYAAYSEVSDLIAAEGGANPERIAPFVTPRQLEVEVQTADYYRANGFHVSGTAVVASIDLQQYVESDSGVEVIVYVCLDVSLARLIDVTGADVTPSDRPNKVTLEVALIGEANADLKIDSSEQWSGSSSC